MDKKVTSIVSYCTIIGWLVAYLAGDKENAKFHLNQGLVLAVFGFVAGLALSILSTILGAIPFLGILVWVLGVVYAAVNILTFVLMIVGIINAVNDKEEPLPVIGKIQILK